MELTMAHVELDRDARALARLQEVDRPLHQANRKLLAHPKLRLVAEAFPKDDIPFLLESRQVEYLGFSWRNSSLGTGPP